MERQLSPLLIRLQNPQVPDRQWRYLSGRSGELTQRRARFLVQLFRNVPPHSAFHLSHLATAVAGSAAFSTVTTEGSMQTSLHLTLTAFPEAFRQEVRWYWLGVPIPDDPGGPQDGPGVAADRKVGVT